jgi:hypothetical protein
MFVEQELLLDTPFPAARARLSGLLREGWLRDASGEAYEDGHTAVIRVGPFGDVPGLSKLVRVRFMEPGSQDGIAILPLRWEALGPAGRLLPVLDADIALLPAGTQTRLVISGSYRPPLDGLGAKLDKLMLSRVAVATVRSLLRRVGDELSPAGEPPEAGERPDG